MIQVMHLRQIQVIMHQKQEQYMSPLLTLWENQNLFLYKFMNFKSFKILFSDIRTGPLFIKVNIIQMFQYLCSTSHCWVFAFCTWEYDF